MFVCVGSTVCMRIVRAYIMSGNIEGYFRFVCALLSLVLFLWCVCVRLLLILLLLMWHMIPYGMGYTDDMT